MRDAVRGVRARAWGVRDLTAGKARRTIRRIAPNASPSRLEWGVNLVGYFDSGLGLGEAARAVLAALNARGIPAVAVPMRRAPVLQRATELDTVAPAAAPYAVNLFCVNGDGMRGFLRQQSPGFFAGRYSIGMWWWEVIPAPARWAKPSARLDEIWVGSDHVKAAVAPVVEVPVVKMRLPIPFPAATAETRTELGLPDGFVFYSAFDYASTFARKNPLGLVEAFRRVFSEGSGAHLVIRSINGRRDSTNRRRLEDAAAGRQDIQILDRYLSTGEKNAMLANCDCYVSLHRAEGFGQPLAEAMRLGKPVIATGWSGNLEFMTDANSYLVEYSMSPVGPGSWPYPANATWAEPDLDHAAHLLGEVFENPASAVVRGKLAANQIRERHDPAIVGERIEARLGHIRDHLQSP
jgi:Glycosyl transferases group 1